MFDRRQIGIRRAGELLLQQRENIDPADPRAETTRKELARAACEAMLSSPPYEEGRMHTSIHRGNGTEATFGTPQALL